MPCVVLSIPIKILQFEIPPNVHLFVYFIIYFAYNIYSVGLLLLADGIR